MAGLNGSAFALRQSQRWLKNEEDGEKGRIQLQPPSDCKRCYAKSSIAIKQKPKESMALGFYRRRHKQRGNNGVAYAVSQFY